MENIRQVTKTIYNIQYIYIYIYIYKRNIADCDTNK